MTEDEMNKMKSRTETKIVIDVIGFTMPKQRRHFVCGFIPIIFCTIHTCRRQFIWLDQVPQ